MKRRTWLLSAAGAAGALIVGWGAVPQRSRMGKASLMALQNGEIAFNGWIKVAADSSVVMAMPRAEMGQGVHTALPMLVAEELNLPLARVRIEQAGADAIYGNVAMLVASLPFHPLESEGPGEPTTRVRLGGWMVGKIARELGINATGGSSSVADAWGPVRLAAAAVRASLLQTAAAQWKLPETELVLKEGRVTHPSGKSAGYGELAKDAAGLNLRTAALKPRKDWVLIGTAAPRADIPAKINGTAQFGVDVRLPGMVYAAVRHCPMLGGTVGTLDSQAALAMAGVERVVPLASYGGSTAGFAVVAKSWWQANQAALAVKAAWQAPVTGKLDSKAIAASLAQACSNAQEASEGHSFYALGDIDQAEKQAAAKLEALYTAPYLAHATMEPMNCTAQVKDGKVDIWVPTQVPEFARMMAARVAGVSVDAVTLHQTLLGGGFGRRLEVDFVGQAVRVAMDCGGLPVQLIWSREEDTTHDFYRPMNVAQLRASLDEDGKVTGLRIQSAGDAITPRIMARFVPALAGPIEAPDKTTAEGLFDLPYGIAHQKMSHVATKMGVPVGFWRSVGHSHNAFFSESFIDEVALAAKQGQLNFRRQLLAHAPRYQAVLDLAAAKANWGKPLPAGHAQGIALHESFGSIVAEVAEVSLLDGKPRVHRVVCAIDCGIVVNPGIVAQQMESAVIFALSAALYGQIDIVDGVVQQTSFPNYPMVTLAQAPVVETHIVPSERPPSGVGEPGVPPLAPAVANALFKLTGKRLRSLPLVV
jgi:isoquinoline 1-oxidoreductase beta subunit